jgi:hypothetical protein
MNNLNQKNFIALASTNLRNLSFNNKNCLPLVYSLFTTQEYFEINLHALTQRLSFLQCEKFFIFKMKLKYKLYSILTNLYYFIYLSDE